MLGSIINVDYVTGVSCCGLRAEYHADSEKNPQANLLQGSGFS
jgi:hypothetical protein